MIYFDFTKFSFIEFSGLGTICPISVKGDNHMGYMGYRNTINGKIIDPGAIVVIVDTWKSIQ